MRGPGLEIWISGNLFVFFKSGFLEKWKTVFFILISS